MAKKKPTYSSLRQGQTIHVVCLSLSSNFRSFVVMTHMIYSHNEPPPRMGEIIMRLPITLARIAIKTFGNADFFYSRKRATTYCNEQNRLAQLRVSSSEK
jgi:hypothetical protein